MGLFSSEPSPLEKAVQRATDEKLTREDWSLIIDVCNNVNERPERNGPLAVQAVCQRLAINNGNIQLYSLTLLNALAQNCGPAVQHETASTATSACLTKLGTAYTTHSKVLLRLVDILGQLKDQFSYDQTLQQIDVVFNRVTTSPHTQEVLKRAGVVPSSGRNAAQKDAQKFGQQNPQHQPSTQPSAAHGASRHKPARSSAHKSSGAPAQKSAEEQEEEDLKRALELSMQDVGLPQSEIEIAANAGHGAEPRKLARVRALYDFAASEQGELSFATGDIIEVLDVVYKEWWRGKLNQEVGIFPVNYVEQIDEGADGGESVRSMPHSSRSRMSAYVPGAPDDSGAAETGGEDPESSQTRAASMSVGDEAYIFTQAATVDKLLTILASANQEGSGSSIIENEDVQSLYHKVASMRPRVIQLIDEYAQKKQELVDLNNKLLQARRSYDRLMEDAVAGYHRQAQMGVGNGSVPGAAMATQGWPYGQPAVHDPQLNAYGTTQTMHQQVPSQYAPPQALHSQSSASQVPTPQGQAPQYTPQHQQYLPQHQQQHQQQQPQAPQSQAPQSHPPQQPQQQHYVNPQQAFATPPYSATSNGYMPSPAESRQSVASPPYNQRLPYPDPMASQGLSGSLPYANGVPTDTRRYSSQ